MKHELVKILDVTLKVLNLTPEQWKERGRSRDGQIVRARQIVSYIAYKEGYYCTEIASFLKQHRTTILHHITVIQDMIRFYPSFNTFVKKIFDKLGPEPPLQTSITMYGWLARGCNRLLTFSPVKPEAVGGYWLAEGTRSFPKDQFQHITYETGPVKVKIKVTIEEDETM